MARWDHRPPHFPDPTPKPIPGLDAGDERLCGQHDLADRARVEEDVAGHLCRVDDAGLHEVLDGVRHGIGGRAPPVSNPCKQPPQIIYPGVNHLDFRSGCDISWVSDVGGRGVYQLVSEVGGWGGVYYLGVLIFVCFQ